MGRTRVKIRRRIWILAAIPMLLSACGKKMAGPMFAQTQVPADLVICTDQEPLVYEPVVKEFEERTGLSVEVKAGTSENVRQMFEQAKDKPVVDEFMDYFCRYFEKETLESGDVTL